MSVVVPIDLDEKSQCELIERYVKNNLSEPSVDVFIENVGHDMFNLEKLIIAAGKAMLNEALVNLIKLGMSVDKSIQNVEGDNK